MKGRGPIVRRSGGRSSLCGGKSIACSRFPPGLLALAVRFDVQPFWRDEIGWGKAPAVDIVDEGNAYEITADLPGMDESNIDVKFSDGTLTIKGEKRDKKEEKKKDYYLSERRYGSFQRSFSVPDGVDADGIEANFKNGVLTVTLPKTTEAQKSEKKITIKKA
jgi:HSP20 family protein